MKFGWGTLLASITLVVTANANQSAAPAKAETAQAVKAWTRPSWGFVSNPHFVTSNVAPGKLVLGQNIASSLIFDQKSDTVSYRPIPEALLRVPTQVATLEPGENVIIAEAPKPAPFVAIPTPIVVAQAPTNTIVTVDSRSAPAEKILLDAKMPVGPKASYVDPLQKVISNSYPWNELTKSVRNATSAGASPAAGLPKVAAVAPTLSMGSLPAGPSAAPVAPFRGLGPQGKEAAQEKDATKTRTQTVVDAPTPTPPAPINATKTASIVVVDGESLNMGEIKLVKDAEIFWIGYESGLRAKVNDKGEGFNPYPNTISARFVVHANGYVPAVGYTVQGVRTIVSLISEQRLPAVLKSLDVVPDPDHVMVFGKLLSAKNQPVANIGMEATIAEPFKIFHSVGSFGLFHPRALATGTSGDFFVSGLSRTLQYLMPSEVANKTDSKDPEVIDWPASIIDLAGIGPVISHTIQEAKKINRTAQVQDAFSFERPDGVGIRGTIGGYRGVLVPSESGEVDLSGLAARPSVDLVEIRADRYLTTWLSAPAAANKVPEAISLFTHQHLSEIFAEVPESLDRSRGIVFGNLEPDRFQDPVAIKVLDANGREDTKAKVHYFNAQNRIQPRQDRTHSANQNFSITGLEPGEYHLIVVNPENGAPIAMQIVRAAYETVSQIQF